MRICLITGSYPPQVCGVGDYTRCLAQSLQAAGDEVVLFHREDWSIARLYQYVRELRALEVDLYLLQYPTEGYGYSVLPQFLLFGLLGRRRFVTLHEYSRKSLKGRLAIYLFFLSGCQFVFTNQLDSKFASRWAPWIGRPRIIPIGSNIPWNERGVPKYDLAYFGLVRPHKGIEEFIEKAQAFAQQVPEARVAIIGDVPRGYEAYAEAVLSEARSAGFAVEAGLDMQKVGHILSQTKICYFPFAEGLSERRGSVLAALGNGSLVVGTSFEPGSNPEFRRAAVVTGPGLDLTRIHEMNESGAFHEVKQNAREYCRMRSWSSIAAGHGHAFRGATA